MKKIILFIILPLLSIGQTQIGKDINGESAFDYSGTSVSLSGDGFILAIGSPARESSTTDAGYVRVYKNVSSTWTQIGATINGEVGGDNSGTSVSLSSDGSILAIGAPYNDANGFKSGSVRVYKNVSGTWTQIGADINGETAGNVNAISVSLSSDGSVLAIGAARNDAGSVCVYKNVSGTWTKVGVDINGEEADDQSGRSVSLSSDGSIVAVGAFLNDGNGTDSGSVRVYKNVSGIWTQIGADIYGEVGGDRSGTSVSLSSDGSIIAIGSPNNNGSASLAGSVRVYKNLSGTWTQIGDDIDGKTASEYNGTSVSLSSDGSIVAIGAPFNKGRNGNYNGLIRVYKNASGIWEQAGTDIDGGDYYASGRSVSLSGDGKTAAIGSPAYNVNGISLVGTVQVYSLSAVLSSDSFVLANFSVYPNPASEMVTISLQEGLTLEKVNVYNALGQLVKTENKDFVAVNSLAKGSYFFEVITNKGKATKQIIVQ